MPDNPTPYPDAATVEAVIAKLPALTISHEPEHSARKQARVREVAATLAAARRVEQEQATKLFERQWDSVAMDGWWVLDDYLDVVAVVTPDGTVRRVAANVTIADLRALAAYVEGLEWGAPGQETGA